MKKTILLSMMIIITCRMYSDDFMMTFTSTGSAPVEDINAVNLTTNESITVPGSVPLILHTTSTEILTTFENSSSGRIYPNPSDGLTELFVNIKKAQTIKLLLINQAGRILVQKNQYLSTGNHFFLFSVDNPGLYFVNVITNEGIESYKALCLTKSENENSLVYKNLISVEKEFSNQSHLKNADVGNQLDYTLGDIILYTCRSGFYKTIIADSPTGSKDYSVEFVKCTDADSNRYGVVKIDTLWWMAENLKSVHFQNGNIIPMYTSEEIWDTLTTGAFCMYNNRPDTAVIYGNLYNYYAVNDKRKICPAGWHVSANDEWKAMIDYLGGSNEAGGKLKLTSGHWASPNTGATNESGFSALPGGFNAVDHYDGISIIGFWWTSTEYSSDRALDQILYSDKTITMNTSNTKNQGFSVRCVRDAVNY
jgi:uncharacterized protein (TIGR02145 family)